MSIIKKMTPYVKEINDLGISKCEETSFEFKLKEIRKDKTFGSTTTCIENVKKREVVIDLNKIKKDFPDEEMFFVAALITVFHEFNHVEQYYYIQKNDCFDLAVSFLACQNNDEFYYFNYKNILYELEAEYDAITKTYNYLVSEHPELNAIHLLKKYISNKINADDRRYVKRGFDEIIKDSDENFMSNFADVSEKIKSNVLSEEVKMNDIYYTYNDIKCGITTVDFNDNLIYHLLEECEKIESKSRFNDNKFFRLLDSGNEQLKFIASYALHVHPEYKEFFKDERIKDLSFEKYVEKYQKLEEELNNIFSKGDIGKIPTATDRRKMFMLSLMD